MPAEYSRIESVQGEEARTLFDKRNKGAQNTNVENSLRNEKKAFVAIVPRGEVVRNFIYSGAFENIARELPVSLISVDLGEEIQQIIFKNFAPVYPLIEYDERWIVRFQREILETAHNRWLWSRAARERARLRDAEAITVKQKIVRRAKKVISRPVANRAGLGALSKIERASSRIFKTTDEYLGLYRNIKPSLVFNGSHVHSRVATQAVQAAQWLKIPTATFIFSWDNLTSQGRIMLPYDYYLVWNEQLKTDLLKLYPRICADRVFVTGTPQFDCHFRPEFYQSHAEFCRTVGAAENRPLIFYTTGMANHMPGEPEIVEEIADLLTTVKARHKPQLLVRIYPKDQTGRFEKLKRRRPDILFQPTHWEKNWLTPRREDAFGLINALRHCALGINVASTVSLELCMFDKPVINVGYNPATIDPKALRYADYYEFDHYRPVVTSGAVEVARTVNEMKTLLAENLQRPERRHSERKELIRQMFGQTLDGNSAERVAQTLVKIAQNNFSAES